MLGFAMVCIWFAYYASQRHAPPNPFWTGNLFEHRWPSSNMIHISHIKGCHKASKNLHEQHGKLCTKSTHVRHITTIYDIYVSHMYIIFVLICAALLPCWFCVFFTWLCQHACEQSLGGRSPQAAPAWASRWLNAESYAIHGSWDLCGMSHEIAWDRMSCGSCDRPSQQGLGCKRLCSSCRAWKNTKSMQRKSRFSDTLWRGTSI